MQMLIDQPDLRRQLENAAFQRAATTYAPERHYERVMSVFEALLRRSASTETIAEQV
jgi:hypothetical protein